MKTSNRIVKVSWIQRHATSSVLESGVNVASMPFGGGSMIGQENVLESNVSFNWILHSPN